jgi:hypothetical protein
MVLVGLLFLLLGWLTVQALRALLVAVVLLCWLAARLCLLMFMGLAALLCACRHR